MSPGCLVHERRGPPQLPPLISEERKTAPSGARLVVDRHRALAALRLPTTPASVSFRTEPKRA